MDDDFNVSADDGLPSLGNLAKAAGYKAFRMDGNTRAIPFVGRSREWLVAARTGGNGWLNVYAMVCEVPPEPGVRARLLEAAMRANRAMSLAKFIATDKHLVLEIDYRREHVDAEGFRNLVGLLISEAEEHYPRLFRIVSGDDVLKALSAA